MPFLIPIAAGLGLTTATGALTAAGGAALAGAGALGGAAISAGASNKASDQASQAAANTLGFQKDVYNQAQGNLNPYITQGQNSNTALAGLLGTGGDQAAANQAFQNYLGSTNYQFQLGQGWQGIQYATAPAFSSGATAKALNNYAQGQAGSALSGYETMLQNQATQGVNAASSLAGTGVNAGSTISSANQANAATQTNLTTANAVNQANVLGQLSKAFGANTVSSYPGQAASPFAVTPQSITKALPPAQNEFQNYAFGPT